MAQRVRRETLEEVARRAIAACGGAALTEAALRGRAGAPWMVGAGKAVGAMAAGARRALGARFRAGPLIGKHAAEGVTVAGHPLPDERGARAAEALLAFVRARGDGEEVVVLLSGGASALIGAPVDGISLPALRAATETLLAGGAAIAEINVVRRHIGRALGGRLAAATRATVEVLALSDVIGDEPAAIGSGPASADPSTFADALAVAERYGIVGEVRDYLGRGARGGEEETPKPGDPRLGRATHRILATPATLRARAVEEARAAGLRAEEVGRLVDGDVEAVAAEIAGAAAVLPTGAARIAVGEPTVRLRGKGRGGRAQQLALGVARAIAGTPLLFAAVGSDGSDGPTDAAGAVVDGETWQRARGLGLDPAAALDGNDAWPLLDAVGALVRTGPTGTNLLDLHLLARG
jgi:glycerate 2-kinase